MKTFEKNYVGKGTQVENMDIVKVTLKVDELLKHKHVYKGEEYVTIEVAKMQQPDKFDRTHTAYVSVLKKQEEPAEK
jgi:low affinity Fe/Cu permease